MQDYKHLARENYDDKEYKEWSSKAYLVMSFLIIIIMGIAGEMEFNDSVSQVPKPSCELIGGVKVCGRKENDF